MASAPPPLPIDAVLAPIRDALAASGRLVLQAPPGAGKTTRVPPLLLEDRAGEVLVVEPRRLAARMAARRVAEERGERVGQSVGYEVRFERAAGPSTRLRYVTEGVLLRKLAESPLLDGVAAIVLDEFHERHLQGDLALALLRRLSSIHRPDLALVVMSATLDAGPVAQFLSAPIVTSEGRRFEVTIEHLPRPDDRPLESQIVSALRRLVGEGLDGDVLVFLPGAGEIRKAAQACAPLAAEHDLLVLPLHGDLSPAEQDRAVRPADRRKVILSTNVAESSVTIEGVVAVVDSGLARVARHDPWSGRQGLVVEKISRASAAQRAGRAGRLRPGRALRLFTRGDHDVRPEHDAPEVMRADMAEPLLLLRALGIRDPLDLAWLDPPPRAALEGAHTLLLKLGALDEAGEVTVVGREMLALPLPPRMARLAVEAERLSVGEHGRIVAVMLAEGRDLYARTWDEPSNARFDGPSDIIVRLDDFLAARERGAGLEGGAAAEARRLGLDPGACAAIERACKRLEPRARIASSGEGVRDERILRAVLAAYPDRVARRRTRQEAGRAADGRDLLLASGGSAKLSPASVVQTAPWLVAVEASDRGARSGTGARGGTVVWLASAISPEWLIGLYPGSAIEQIEVAWNAELERVDALERLVHERLVIDEGPAGAAARDRITGLLVERAMAEGVRAFAGGESLERLDARIRFVLENAPDLAQKVGLAPIDDARLGDIVRRVADGKRSFAELRSAGLLDWIKATVGGPALALVDELAPESIVLAGGRRVRVDYVPGQPPSIASRLQDFFGSRDVPRLARGRVALVVHLRAPNGRDVQVTTDLAGFWARTYPGVRSELARRYPRHAWPADPLSASPPPAAPRRPPPG